MNSLVSSLKLKLGEGAKRSELLSIEFPTLPSCAKVANASWQEEDDDGRIRFAGLVRSSPEFKGVESEGVAIEPKLSGEVARVLGLGWEEVEVVPSRARVPRTDALALARMTKGSLVNSQVMPLDVHF